ncbi:hypothetical protein [Streptomyces massasporeus]|uniref:hypothetical protein n=1 Tax=Streptomyces massasporeus TaxID=67324 RepID=UPI0033CDDED6
MTHTATDDPFEDPLAVFTDNLRTVLTEDHCRRFADRIRQVHTDWPELAFPDAAALAKASLLGQRRNAAERLEASKRIQAALPEIERLGLLSAEHESVAAAFTANGITCADINLLESDVVWIQQIADKADEDGAHETL